LYIDTQPFFGQAYSSVTAPNITWRAEYDGDGKDDQAVYRNGTWYELRSNNTIFVQDWGFASDVPVPAGYLP
jgi:hypothetical protein